MGPSETTFMIPPRAFLRMCRRRMRQRKMVDSSGMAMNGAQLLLRSLIFRRLLRREVLAPDEKHVGLLVPPSIGGALANAALSIDGRVLFKAKVTASETYNTAELERLRPPRLHPVLTPRPGDRRVPDLQMRGEQPRGPVRHTVLLRRWPEHRLRGRHGESVLPEAQRVRLDGQSLPGPPGGSRRSEVPLLGTTAGTAHSRASDRRECFGAPAFFLSRTDS